MIYYRNGNRKNVQPSTSPIRPTIKYGDYSPFPIVYGKQRVQTACLVASEMAIYSASVILCAPTTSLSAWNPLQAKQLMPFFLSPLWLVRGFFFLVNALHLLEHLYHLSSSENLFFIQSDVQLRRVSLRVAYLSHIPWGYHITIISRIDAFSPPFISISSVAICSSSW